MAGRTKTSILLVEDDLHVADLVRDLLESAGYRVEWTGDGLTALAILTRDSYDLVLCDVVLPGLSGMGLYEQLAERRPHMLSRLIFISGYGVPEIEDLASTTGIPLLRKPFQLDDLRRTVEEVLRVA